MRISSPQRQLATVPQSVTEPYSDTTRTVERMLELASGRRGEMSLKLRLTVENIVREVKPRDKLSQMFAIYDWFNRRFSYLNDPVNVEQVKDPERLLEEIEKHGKAVGDCDDASTFFYAALRTIGIETQFTRAAFNVGSAYSHVFAMGRDQSGRWIVLDPVAGPRTSKMISQIKHAALGLGSDTIGYGSLAAVGISALAGYGLAEDKTKGAIVGLLAGIAITCLV